MSEGLEQDATAQAEPRGARWGWARDYLAIPGGLLLVLIAGGSILKWTKLRSVEHRVRGKWAWSDSTIFEFQRVRITFTPDSFFLSQRFMNPKDPKARMPCAGEDYQIHSAGRYEFTADSLRFRGNFTDYRYMRDTLRLCRDTGFRGVSQYRLSGDTLCLKGPGSGLKSTVCMVRMGGKAAESGPRGDP